MEGRAGGRTGSGERGARAGRQRQTRKGGGGGGAARRGESEEEEAVVVVPDTFEDAEELPSVAEAWAAAEKAASELAEVEEELAGREGAGASAGWEEFAKVQGLENVRKRQRELEEAPLRAARAEEKEWAKRVAKEKARVPVNEAVLRRATMRIAGEVHNGLTSGALRSWRLDEFLRQQALPKHRRPLLMHSPLLFRFGNAFLTAEDEQRVIVFLDKFLRAPGLPEVIPGVDSQHYLSGYQVDVLGPEVLNRLPRALGLTHMSADEVQRSRDSYVSLETERYVRQSRKETAAAERFLEDNEGLYLETERYVRESRKEMATAQRLLEDSKGEGV